MQIYFARLWWYFAVALLFVGICILPTEFLARSLLLALALYVPVSILWTFFAFMFYRQCGYSERMFGIPSEKAGYGLLCVGIVMAVSYLVFRNFMLAESGFLVAFSGIDWMLMLREGKELTDRKKRDGSNNRP